MIIRAFNWRILFWTGLVAAIVTDILDARGAMPLFLVGWLTGLYTMSMWHDKTRPAKSIKSRKSRLKQNEAPKKRKR